jgi:hypothetical protein
VAACPEIRPLSAPHTPNQFEDKYDKAASSLHVGDVSKDGGVGGGVAGGLRMEQDLFGGMRYLGHSEFVACVRGHALEPLVASCSLSGELLVWRVDSNTHTRLECLAVASQRYSVHSPQPTPYAPRPRPQL